MIRNVGNLDRYVRFALAVPLFSLFFVFDGPMRFIGLVGLVPLLTGAMNFCPLYRLLGINSCPISKRSA